MTTDRTAMKIHERARTLAAEAIDGALVPADAAWLAGHLKSCGDCRVIAGEYRSIHDELRGLAVPEPPRDLWARTASGFDAVDAARSRSARSRSGRPGAAGRWGFFSGNRLAFARAGAFGLTAAVASLALLTGGFGGVFGPSTSGPTGGAPTAGTGGDLRPVAVVGGNGYYVAPSGGGYQITSSSAGCTDAAKTCAVSNDGGTVMTSVVSKSAVSVAVAPDASQAAVWTADKIVILPLGANAAKTVSIDLLTPRPTVAPTATPATTPTPEPSSSSEVTPDPSESPEATTTPTLRPTRGPDVAPGPVAILDGYRVVGRAPEFSPGGEWVAFSARPAGAGSGADVYVWRAGWDRAVRVTETHAALFAGWFGDRVLISDFVSAPVAAPTAAPALDASPSAEVSPTPEATPGPPVAVSYVYDPVSGLAALIRRPMLLPSVDPTGKFLVYWSGTATFNSASGLWEAGNGDLYFDAWSNLKLVPIESGGLSALALEPPSADGVPAGQLLPVWSGPGSVQLWVVRWDAMGRNVAVWVGGPGSADSGHVTLFHVDQDAGRLDTENPVLSATARSNVAFDDSSLVYTSPAAAGGSGQTYIVPVPSPTATPAPTPSGETSPATQTPQDFSGLQSARPAP